VSTVAAFVDQIDNNYVGTNYPWCKIKDPVNDKFIWVPSSVPVLGAFSQNDKLGFEWYAVAGLNRGGLLNVVDV